MSLNKEEATNQICKMFKMYLVCTKTKKTVKEFYNLLISYNFGFGQFSFTFNQVNNMITRRFIYSRWAEDVERERKHNKFYYWVEM